MSAWYWLSYANDTFLKLDEKKYEKHNQFGRIVLKPEWVCIDANGGMHISNGINAVSIHVTKPPPEQDQINGTTYGVYAVRTDWLNTWYTNHFDSDIFIGDVYVDNTVLKDWKTIRTKLRPVVRGSGERFLQKCEICGHISNFPIKNEHLDVSSSYRDKVFATEKGIFIPEKLWEEKCLLKPNGSFPAEKIPNCN